ncbi:MAG: peptidase C11 [Oscillospiraceae bacterium]|nr:peptidase C11 [Oscillospiraceae bacterium]
MPENRPQGRKTKVTGQSTGAYRRGSGLNTGPVGSGNSNPFSQSGSGQRRPGMSRATKAGGGGGLLIIVIAVLFFLLRGGGLGGLLGETAGSSGSSGSLLSHLSGTNVSSFANLFGTDMSLGSTGSAGSTASSGSAANSGSAALVNSSAVDTSVAADARDKRTKILGNGQDEVTIMIYMCGTDLESRSGMATKDLVEMTRATIGPNVNVLVCTGGCSKWNNNIISSRQNQIYEVHSGGLKCVVDNFGNSAMTDPTNLTDFIKWCDKNYSANRKMLILWDHGGGSVSGYGYDEKNQRSGSMNLAGISTALKNGKVKFDIVGFDACLMATLETGLMLDPYADYMIASEETEPGIGWYYTDWLTKLSNNTSMKSVDIGKNIVDDFVRTCSSQCPGQSATLSVVDLAELSATAPEAMKDFSDSMTTLIKSNGYQQVSNARNNTREFARSTAIDQIDLVHFAMNLGNQEGKDLAAALKGAIKYNRTSSNMANSYGLSIYFPYRKTSNVDKAVRTYEAIGMDPSYSQCIRAFASMEVSGQYASGGSNSPYSSLMGGGYSGASSSGYDITDLLGAFLGGRDFSSIPGMGDSEGEFLSERGMNTEDMAQYIAATHFDPSLLTWTKSGGSYVIHLPEEQWAMVEGLALNIFVDDGKGYIDLGLDAVFEFDENGDLLAPAASWVAINDHPVAYYHEYMVDNYWFGYTPALLNGERVELQIRFDPDGNGEVVGIRSVYEGEELQDLQELPKTQTEPGAKVDLKNTTDADAETRVRLLQPGDVLDFLCDCYHYDGSYENSYKLGAQLIIGSEGVRVANVPLDGERLAVTYRFTDLYQQHYWSQTINLG